MTNHPNRSKRPCRPRDHLAAAGKLYPLAWRQVDEFRAARGKSLPAWPDWCFLPLAASYAIVSADAKVDRLTPVLATDVSRLGALAAWRVTQGIYRYDPTLYAALIDTPLAGDIPCDVLYLLPEWCVYIETPGREYADGDTLHGFFAHLEWDANTQRHELRLLLDSERALTPVPIHLGAWTLEDAVTRAVTEGQRQAVIAGASRDAAIIANNPWSATLLADFLAPLMSLLLYVCTENAELGDGSRRPENPRPKRTKAGWRMFPADKPTTWDVSVRLGAALRRAYHAAENEQQEIDADTGRTRPRAHIRRAHWHTFLAGEGRSERRLKWLPPIPVNVDDVGDLPATVRPVR